MAEPQATNQDGDTPKPEAAQPETSRIDSRGRSGSPMTERQYLAERRERKQAVAEAAKTLTESAEQPKPESEAQPVQTEETAETSREETETQVPDAADAQTEGEQQASQAEPDEGYFPETLTEFAEAVGVDPKDFMQGVTTTVKVNGQEQTVALNDLLEAYSSKSERDRLGVSLAEDRKALEAKVEQHEREYQTRLQQTDQLLGALQASIEVGPNDQQLLEMLQSGKLDERGYVTARAERDQKVAAFNELLGQRNQAVQQRAEEMQETAAQYRKGQQDALLAWKPDLNEASKLTAFQERLRSGLTGNYGFTDAEVGEFFGNFNVRQVQIIDDALAYRELKSKEAPIKDRIAQLPKLVKPGPKRTVAQQAQTKVMNARNRLRSAQDTESGVALLRERRLARRNQTDGGSQ